MAYMSQQRKAELAPKIKEICKKYGVKASISVHNHSQLCVTIKQGKIDFVQNYNSVGRGQNHRNWGREWVDAQDSLDVNVYWYKEHFNGVALDFLEELVPAMNVGNHDRSDAQVDYFDIGWYIDVKIGKWNKPYELI